MSFRGNNRKLRSIIKGLKITKKLNINYKRNSVYKIKSSGRLKQQQKKLLSDNQKYIRNAQDDLRNALNAYQKGLAVIEGFMRKDPNSGLVPVRDRLLKKIQGLAPSVQ